MNVTMLSGRGLQIVSLGGNFKFVTDYTSNIHNAGGDKI